jgi:hypothetical protein
LFQNRARDCNRATPKRKTPRAGTWVPGRGGSVQKWPT